MRSLRLTTPSIAALALALAISLSLAIAFPIFGLPGAMADDYVNSLGMSFIRIPKGSFMMGSDPRKDPNAKSDEIPEHMVNITKAFYLGKNEVTQREWKSLMGNNPSKFIGPDNPVDNVSYYDALRFIEKLNQKEKTNRYRLPTEAEWTYAAIAGSPGVWHFGNNPADLPEYAWYSKNSSRQTHEVGLKKPNPWGLFDLYGNVWEWVSDYYSPDYYATGPNEDPKGPEKGNTRVIRGGAFDKSFEFLRAQNRTMDTPGLMNGSLGFRVAFTPAEKKLRLFKEPKK
jgi:formylglycine-generating enzyme required for sulfatase activity